MNRSDNGGRGRYSVALVILVFLVMGIAALSLFLGAGGSVRGFGFGVFGTNPQPPRQETLDRGRRAAWAGDYDAALAALDSVIEVRPDESDLLEERARVLAWAERWEEAAAALAEATDTADTEAVLERARYLWWGSRPLEADSLLSSLLEREPGLEAALALQDEIRPGIDASVDVAQRWAAERPDDAQTRLWLARALVEAGRPEDALPHYRRALTGEGAVSPDVLLEAAGVALGVDALDFAAEHFRRYLDEVDPYDREVRLRLARTLAWSARWTEAEARYREALTAIESTELRLELARMLADAGRYEDAIVEYRRVLEARRSREVRRELVDVLAQAEEYAAAVRELDRVMETDPDPALLEMKADLLALMDRYGEAADVLATVLERRPDDHELRLRRARLLWWSGRLEEADAELTALIGARPDLDELVDLRERIREGIDPEEALARRWVALDDTPRNRLRLARILVERERYGEAVTEYRTALADTTARALVVEAVDVAEAADSLDAATAFLDAYLADADDRALVLRLARLHGWAGRPDVAAGIYARYLADHPTDVDARFARAQQLALQDSTAWEEATSELERVVAADPDRGPALKLLGDLERWRGRPGAALAFYRRARAVDPDTEGLATGIRLANAMLAEAAARRDATYVAWAGDLDVFDDSDDFDWVALDLQRSWKRGRWIGGLELRQRYAAGASPGGLSGSAAGLGAAAIGTYRIRAGLEASVEVGVTSYADVGPFVTWGAGVERADSVGRTELRYDRLPAVRDAATLAALEAEAVVDRVVLEALRPVGRWRAAGNLQLQAFSVSGGSVTRYAGMLRADRPVGASGLTVGGMVRGIFADTRSPVDPVWGPVVWTPTYYIAPAVTLGYSPELRDGWSVALRASPGYAFIEERAGLTRYRASETAILEAGATVGYRTGPWSFSVSGDWGGALPDGYRARALRIRFSRLAEAP